MKKALQDNLKFLIIAIILLIVFQRHAVAIITALILAYLGYYSILFSKVMPQISLEIITPSAILMGYVFGWPVGLAFGFFAGFACFVRAGIINLTIIIVSLLMGFTGAVAALLETMGFPFWLTFEIAYVIRGGVGYFVNSLAGQAPVENFMHSVVEGIYNMVVVVNFYIIIHNILILFV